MVGKDLLKILKESKYTTVLSGFEMLQENGYPAIRDGEESYDIEQKYGYSVDEMFTSAFYSTRKPQFFEFYRNELLSALDIPPGKGYLEMAELEEAILCGADLRQTEVLAAHADWAEEFLTRHSEVNSDNNHEIVQQEIGLVFMQVLEDAGVYKCTEDGRKGFERFIDRLNA